MSKTWKTRFGIIGCLSLTLTLVCVAYAATNTVTIAAQPWQSTGVKVTKNTIVKISASGKWSGDGKSWCGPDGLSGVAPKIFLAPGLPSAGLVGKLGDYVFFVGSSCTLDGANCGTGTLGLGFNDEVGGYGDNQGSLEVVITTEEK